jgi:hypothetical protein
MVDIGQASSRESVATLLYMSTCLMSASPPQFLPETKAPDLVVKCQPVDIPGLVLQQILRPSVMYERDIKG